MPTRCGRPCRLLRPADLRDGGSVSKESSESVGVIGKDSELADDGYRTGRVGMMRGEGGASRALCCASKDATKVGEVGEAHGVLRRTKEEMGVLAVKSDAER